MMSLLSSVVLLACLLCQVHFIAAEDVSGPMHLKTVGDSFKDTIKSNSVVVVMFYASWCSISKKLMQPFDDMYTELRSEGVTLAKVNCIEEPELYWQYDIKGFPTFILFKDGESLLYEGEPEIMEIRKFITENAANSVAHLDPETFYDLDLKTRPLAVEFFDETTALDCSSTFDFACKKFKFPYCYTSTSQEFADLLGVTIPSRVVIREYPSAHRIVSESISSTTDEFADSNALLEWMQNVSFPALVEHTEENRQLMFFPKRPGFQTHLLFFIEEKLLPGNREILEVAEAMGNEFNGKLVVTFVDRSNSETEERVEGLLEDTEVSSENIPTAVIIHSATKFVKFYKLPRDTTISHESMSHWVNQFLQRKLVHDKIIGEE